LRLFSPRPTYSSATSPLSLTTLFRSRLEAERWLLLVHPGLAISTAWAYERLAAVRAGQVGRVPGRLPRLAVAHHTEGPQLVKWRSEEHTSELQSPDHLVCRLLLAKEN